MNTVSVLRRVFKLLPDPFESAARKIYYHQRHWAHPSLKGTGSVQDLYYWVSDGTVDTMLLLQNYFSVFYPNLDTDTYGSVRINDESGQFLGEKRFDLSKFATVKLMLSPLLAQLEVPRTVAFGTLECHLEVPNAIMAQSEGDYFFDRFYIGYTTNLGQPAFVHGVDKTHIYREDKPQSVLWYETPNNHQWAPEIPIDIDDYEKIKVIMINRTSDKSLTTLEVSDSNDKLRKWETFIEPGGVHRFELTRSNLNDLDPKELRLKIIGMATRIGRPVLFKEFQNGAISVMHC